MSTRRRRLATVLAMGCLASMASGAAGQACLGVGAQDGQGYLAAHAGFEPDSWTPGGTAGYNAPGPLAVSASFRRNLINDAELSFSTASSTLVAELPSRRVSVCGIALGGYQWKSGSNPLADLGGAQDGFVFGGGAAIGRRFESGSGGLAFTPRVSASVMHTRAGGRTIDAPATGGRTFGRFEGGLTVASGRVFLGPALQIDTLDGSDLMFIGMLGIAF